MKEIKGKEKRSKVDQVEWRAPDQKLTTSQWKVHKFGGTSVAGADRYRNVVKLIRADEQKVEQAGVHQAIVVSAMSRVTDALIELVSLAARGDQSYLDQLEKLQLRHQEVIRELGLSQSSPSLVKTIDLDFRNLRNILTAVELMKAANWQLVELVSGYGELWSAQILAATFNQAGLPALFCDARNVLQVDSTETTVRVDWSVSQRKMDEWRRLSVDRPNQPPRLVITGFIAARADGSATTLKRNGSDYSASIFGKLLRAKEIWIWTDVDGVLSADPRLVPDAVVLEEMSYAEATELAYFGAKVVHPSTMAPAIEDQIPIWIKNTFRPEAPGTKIHVNPQGERHHRIPVKGFSTIEGVALFNIEGTGMIGVPGVSERLFGALRSAGISVILISQASSEQSICFAILERDAERAAQELERIFQSELLQKKISRIAVEKNCTVLAAVGDGMIQQVGVAGRLFTALARAGVSVKAIAQGSSERNISVVIAGECSKRGLRAAHAAFHLSPMTLSIGIVGAGGVGKTLIEQIAREKKDLKERAGIDLRVNGIATSKTLWKTDDSSHRQADDQFLSGQMGNPLGWTEFLGAVSPDGQAHRVLVDATASDHMVAQYEAWMQAGFHIVTPNKKAPSGPLDRWNRLKKTREQTQKHILFETTVGAALPVIQTLRDLVETGDEIIQFEGVLSGTLSYLFNEWDGKSPFSQQLKRAFDLGYTEPDPREDLSGSDVARKLVILAREQGLLLECENVAVESLVSSAMKKLDREELVQQLGMSVEGPELKPMNEHLQGRFQEAHKVGGCLRYVAAIREGRGSASLQILSGDHPFARLRGTDNCFVFKTKRYCDRPLVIQGPGAGRELTAGGVFAELLRLVRILGYHG